MKQHSLIGQVLLHFPSLFFLLLLAAAVFILPEDDILPPVDNEVRAQGIIWSRHTAAGEVVRLSAPTLLRKADGVVNVENVRIDTVRQGNAVYLQGVFGTTDKQYQQIRLQDTVGEIISDDGRITLTLVSALYDLSGGNRLQGSDVNITKDDNRFSGDSFLWDSENLFLSGNVKASYRQGGE